MPTSTFLHGRRASWSAIPAVVGDWVADHLGDEITGWTDCTGGMSVGVAAIVHTATRSAFVKALDGGHNPQGQQLYHREASMAARLPRLREIPALIAAGDVDADSTTWTVNMFEAAPGRTADHPWSRTDLVAVLDAWHRITPTLHATSWPEGEPLPDQFYDRWRVVHTDADDPWHDLAAAWASRCPAVLERIAGDAEHPPVLTHLDLRADNILLGDTSPNVWFVDWALPALAAGWLDPAILFADVVASGADLADGGAVDVVTLWQEHPATSPYDVELMVCLVAAIGFALHVGASRPPSPLFEHQRRWERAMADGIAPFIRRHRR